MRNKAISIGLGALACIFLAVTPVAGEDTSADPSDNPALSIYHQILEWIGVSDDIAALMSRGSSAPAAADASTGTTGGGAYPEGSPYIPPGG